MQENNRGYIAVTSAILIAFLIMTITIALSLSVYFSRFNVLGSEAKERSLGLAEACADTALFKLASSSAYAGNETTTVDSPNTCHIFTVTVVGSQKTIKTTATFQSTVTNIKVLVNQTSSGGTPSIISWEETP